MINDLDVILNDGGSYTVEFFKDEGRVRYDEIARGNLPITEYFNDVAWVQVSCE